MRQPAFDDACGTARSTRSRPASRVATEWSRRVLLAFAILLVGMLPARAHAQSGEGGFASGHGWAVIEDTTVDDLAREAPRWVVMHLPPAAPGRDGAGLGIVRPAERLQKRPERLAWLDANLYFVMPSETVIVQGRRQLRRVYSMYAERTMANTWIYIPLDGPGIETSLPGEGELVGFVGAGGGRGVTGSGTGASVPEERDLGAAPAALIYLGPDASTRVADNQTNPDLPVARAGASPLGGAWRLMVMVGREWVDVPLPWQRGAAASPPPVEEPLPTSAEARSRVWLVSTPAGVGVLTIGDGDRRGEATWWTCRLRGHGAVSEGTETTTWVVNAPWERETLSLGSDPNASRLGDVVTLEGRPMSLRVDDGLLTARLLLREGPVEVARKEGVGRNYQIVPRGGSPGVMSILWTVEKRAADATSADPKERKANAARTKREPMAFEMFEFFASGRVLHDGAAKQDGPLSIREVQIIAALLGGILLAVMVFVLKPEKALPDRLVKALPRGWAPAAIGRRLIASIIDLSLGFVVARAIVGVEWDHVMELVLTGSAREWMTLGGMTLAMTWIMPSLGEWHFGRSLGKWAVDCRVISLRGLRPAAGDVVAVSTADSHAPATDRVRLQLWQAMARNALKWIPPLTFTVLLGPRTRHFADQVAGTIVIEQEPPAPERGE